MSLIAALLLVGSCAIISPFLERILKRNAGYFYAGVFILALFTLIQNWKEVVEKNSSVSFEKAWISQLDINFALKLDGLGLLFSILILGIGALVLIYSCKYLPKEKNASFYALISSFAFAMLGLVMVDDIIVLFVFWEFTTLCSFFLISRSGIIGYQPSIRTLILTGAGGLSLLSAVVAVRDRAGTSSISEILASDIWSDSRTFTSIIAVLIVFAAFTKSAQFPFHAWLPDAMAAIMPVSAYLHAAAMVKAGIFLLLRFSPVFSQTPTWNVLLITLGLTTMIMGAVFTLQRDDIKELLAYSTVSQLGFIVATIGIGTSFAIAAALLHIIAHALFKSSLFMSAGMLDKLTGTRKMSELSGIGKTVPALGATITLACLSMASVFPLLGFISKEYILKAVVDSPGAQWTSSAITVAIILGSIITFAYSGKIITAIYVGQGHQVRNEYKSLILAPTIASILGLVCALAISAINPILKSATMAATLEEFSKQFKFVPQISKELGYTIIIYAVGIFVVWKLEVLKSNLSKKLFPGSGVGAMEILRRSLLNFGVRIRNITSIDSPPRHLIIPILMVFSLGLFLISRKPDLDPVIPGATKPSDWFLLCLITIPLLGLTIAKSRISALVLLGSVGVLLTLLYFTLGAPDVGFTQLLIELLTVIFMMFALRRLPKKFHRTSKKRKIASASIAIPFGVLAGLASYVYSGRREISNAGKYYLENAKKDTGGTNVVNTILVDFRALDTLVELTVFATAGLAIMAILISARVLGAQRRPHIKHLPTAADYFSDNNIPVRVVSKIIIPLSILMSVYLMLRGHYEPGGGFIAALVSSVGIAILYLGTDHRNFIHAKWLPYLFIGSGVAIAVLISLAGYLSNSFIKPLHLDFKALGFSFNLTSAIIFDTGVYFAVIGVVLAAINRLSSDSPHESVEKIPHVGQVEELQGPVDPTEVTV